MKGQDAIYRTVLHQTLGGTPAMHLAVAGWQELIERGFADDAILLDSSQSALVAYRSDRPVGVAVFRHLDWSRTLWLVLAYVRPERRRLGIYRRLLTEIERIARRLDCAAIELATHVDNVESQAVHLSLGARQKTIGFILAPALVDLKDRKEAAPEGYVYSENSTPAARRGGDK